MVVEEGVRGPEPSTTIGAVEKEVSLLRRRQLQVEVMVLNHPVESRHRHLRPATRIILKGIPTQPTLNQIGLLL